MLYYILYGLFAIIFVLLLIIPIHLLVSYLYAIYKEFKKK